MKISIKISQTILFAIFLFSSNIYSQTYISSKSDVSIEIRLSKKNYFLGEIVNLQFQVTNNTEKKNFHRGLTRRTSSLQISIAYENESFKKYRSHGPIKDSSGWLTPNISRQFSEKILWNRIPNYVKDSPLYKDVIMSNFAFSKSGNYLIKAKLILPNKKKVFLIETLPISVKIKKPTGNNLKVWDLLKNRSDLGYFIQSSGILDYRSCDEDTLNEIRSIIKKYPKSIYAKSMRDSIKKYVETREIIRTHNEKRGVVKEDNCKDYQFNKNTKHL